MVSSEVTAPILVIGMHRSGMSATAGLLAHLGVYQGVPERSQPGDVHNPEGYHELQDAVALNDRLLDWCGSAWDLPPELGDPHLAQLQAPPDLVARLKSFVASMDAEAHTVGRPWAVNDPRLSVLWPFWFEAKPTARVVLCVRNPAAIAQSLNIRNGLSLRFGLKLCEQYFEHLLSIPKERIEAQVRYEELVSDPEKVARDLVCNLRLELDIDRTRTAISGVKAELARNRGRLESMPASIDSHSISRAYARLLAHGQAAVVEPLNPPTLVIAPTSSPAGAAFENEGYCPICDRRRRFVAIELPMRDHYLCEECGSLPRERALMLVIEREYPNWRSLRIHEFGPLNRPVSQRLQRECEGYRATHWLDDTGGGRRYGMYIAERLECLSFKPETFDLHITQEVLKHLESPAAAFAEIARTLKPGGAHIFTVPLVCRDQPSRQRVRRTTEGLVEFLEPPMHHGNPEQRGTLVTMDWGHDIACLIRDASGLETRIIDIDDLEHGVRGEYSHVLISTKPPQNCGEDVVIAVEPARLDQTGGVNIIDPEPVAELGRRAAAAGPGTASLDEDLCQGSSTSEATTPVEVSSLNACAPRLILAGHSHLRAMAGREIYTESSELVAGPGGDGTFIMVGPGPERDMSYFDTLADLATGADVGIVWNGNEHNALYFFEAETPFDFLSPHVPKMKPSAQIVSQAAIRDSFQQFSYDFLDVVLKRLATAGLNRIALIGTPPPKGDNEALRALLNTEGFTEEFFVSTAAQLGHSVDTVPITDPYVRLKLWYLLQDMLAEEARIRGLMFIPVPKEVQDADGFLRREFWWDDVTHANQAYGNVMYETVVRAFN
ncbi:sulfotransferase [Mycobacterium sp. Marseille-P9652]|uniref:sulfotransferase n=1 Tax=Mycobacterium sp. Marseille-P9652 TaxID=2654950 RepID=UPI0012E8087D|nr:sulfotransferase [Mycobacterium sp. Marseille-P9652]